MGLVAVVDYGMGNLRSVSRALESAGGSGRVRITSDADEVRRAERVVFPGVGAIRDCMSELQRLELVEVLRESARSKPFLGVCLGMQALLSRSEENAGTEALDILPGEVRRFPADRQDPEGRRLKVPHMGWNQVHQVQDHPLWADIPDRSWFYFVHSYYVAPERDKWVAGQTEYGLTFASALARGNVFATQFHPEKSQRPGLILLGNFLRWDGSE
ncbi:imidazole glycerol phosphate synthase subunit HisH [Alkalilimnicola ehrlichii MLHE-1]|uniref:Imidazole glycerol phosphate synthase subunit HisH n=1 Tax=Alkalilimnicola ehrlichii (strain ATCC BAA-1101 / DSM 17681 / MLHE-1) TaxID=187272 RepID=Q0A5D1_ALKEH|nr:imidazole glycerol phosphate synthase subunit HisH [Alkalilimnicola ehrlichii]ABI57956.1 imidazole glycerol phosphate synthase subunit hisH [Alkalilimnicola ehrlichii MLHE-1]